MFGNHPDFANVNEVLLEEFGSRIEEGRVDVLEVQPKFVEYDGVKDA
jgi:hypothetical protein